MIISDIHRYVYIGIPRTGSKSVNHWLMENFDGEWHGGHHDYEVPEAAKDYFKFTVVRNPYERRVSGHYAVTWDDQAPSDDQLGAFRNERERLIKFREFLGAREHQAQKAEPRQSEVDIETRRQGARALNESESHLINQAGFVERSQASMALYFERLPQCLAALPFVDALNVPSLLHHPERGIRPTGNFFDHFAGTDEEEVVWAKDADDFRLFGYARYSSELPSHLPNCWVRA